MRPSYFLVLLLVTVVACGKAHVTNADTASIVKLETTSDHSIVNGDNTHRNLKGSETSTVDEDEERGFPILNRVVSFFKGSNPVLAKNLQKNTGLAKQVGALERDTNLINMIKTSPKLDNLRNAVAKNPGALTEKKVGMIGSIVAKLKGVELVGDVYGMVVVYGILFVATILILSSAYIIRENTVASYIH